MNDENHKRIEEFAWTKYGEDYKPSFSIPSFERFLKEYPFSKLSVNPQEMSLILNTYNWEIMFGILLENKNIKDAIKDGFKFRTINIKLQNEN